MGESEMSVSMLDHDRDCPAFSDRFGKCDCKAERIAALATEIAALVQERERCCNAVCEHCQNGVHVRFDPMLSCWVHPDANCFCAAAKIRALGKAPEPDVRDPNEC